MADREAHCFPEIQDWVHAPMHSDLILGFSRDASDCSFSDKICTLFLSSRHRKVICPILSITLQIDILTKPVGKTTHPLNNVWITLLYD